MHEARIAVLELPARFGMPARAFEDVDALLAKSPRPDLVLLPEATFTGYVSETGDFDLARFAEPLDGPTVDAIRRFARRTGTTICAPLIERAGDHTFNAFVVVAENGHIVAHYRKRHPWFPETWATAGDAPAPVFEVAGVTFTIAICFDVHFLERDASDALHASDVLLFPSAWVEGDHRDERERILGDVARRFDVSIANANWGPGAPRVRGQGASRFVAPGGEIARVKSRLDTPLRLDAVLATSRRRH